MKANQCKYCKTSAKEINSLTAQLDASRALLAERDAEIALLRQQSVGWVQVFDENSALRAEVDRLTDAAIKMDDNFNNLSKMYDEVYAAYNAGRSTRDYKDCDNQLYTIGYADGVQAERERCARIADNEANGFRNTRIATAIRGQV